MADDWTRKLAGARMRVDKEFEPQVEDSQFTSQEWGLIMTAVEFDMEYADDPERARLVAKKGKLEEIIPQLDDIQKEMGGAARPQGQRPTRDGVLGKFRQYVEEVRLMANSSGNDDERMAEARSLVDAYATQLQDHLEEQGRWEEMRQAARE